MNATTTYEDLVSKLKSTALLASCSSVLSWDEQTNLPPAGAEHRANQLGLLAGLVHERATSPRIGELLAELEAAGAARERHGEIPPMAANVRESRRVYDRATKLPRRLVEELSRVTCLAQQAWVAARKQKSFP
ncbi:MAG TPA: carboxypeptidase M32, partial [Planctomycetaceae bacterium]|nr:carboxypeptidase M32 [Planctomycetaceae bacterium]